MNPFSDVLEAAFSPTMAAGPPPLTTLLRRFIDGYRHFERTGETPVPAYLAMRQLFCLTNGQFNDVVHQLMRQVQGGTDLATAGGTGVLGAMEGDRLRGVVDTIARDGYHVFDQRLSPELCQSLRRLALETPCTLSGGSAPDQAPALYRPGQPIANRYDLPEDAVARDPHVQALLVDPSIHALATAYLGTQPQLDFVSMWWLASYSRSAEALSKAAQLYHFDLDRLRFLKLFVYLTDVDTRTSPHCYVRGSRETKPPALLRDGRFADEEIARHYRAEDLVEVLAPAGTIFAVDTRGFHKGKVMEAGERLVLQLEYTTSLFGQNYGRIRLPSSDCNPALARLLSEQPTFAGRYSLVEDQKSTLAI